MKSAKDYLILALDVSNLRDATRIVYKLAPYVGCFKVGPKLTTAIGTPVAVKLVRDAGAEVFLDEKWNDIPNTVGGAVAAAAKLKVAMFTVHASSGMNGMIAAAKNKGRAKALACTVLTSFDESDASHVFGASSYEKVITFTDDAKNAGMDGIVCSPRELESLVRFSEYSGLLKIAPGIRPTWSDVGDDQERVMTPGEAIALGANAIVIGRPIVNPPRSIGSQVRAAQLITEEVSLALERRK